MARTKQPAVVVTGVSGNLGRTIARILHRTERVIGVDRRPFPRRPKDVEHHQIDIRRRRAADIFRRQPVKALVHLGIIYDPRLPEKKRQAFNVLGTQQLLELCARHKVQKVVCLSSATVYGPEPDNPNFLTEDAPLKAAIRHGEIRDLVEVDMYSQSFFWRYPKIETVILRPVHVVGPTIQNTASKYLRHRRPWTLAGFDPLLQLIHQEDVARAIVMALKPGVKGIYNVTGPGEAPLSRVLAYLGNKPRLVPHFTAKKVLEKLWALRLTDFPPQELDHLRYLCVVDGSSFRQSLGYEPRYSLMDTLSSVRSRNLESPAPKQADNWI